MDLSFITLSWNSEKYINDCLLSCSTKCTSEKIKAEIFVVDNGSQDNTIALIEGLVDTVDTPINLTKLPENKGTTYPRNLALKQAKGEYICIIDSDTEFGKGSIANALQYLKDNDNVGILAPRLTLPDGTTQNSIKKFPTFIQKLKKLPKAVFGVKVTESDFYTNLDDLGVTEIDSAISACWFFHRRLLTSVGYLDEKIFYAPEDLDYCLRVSKSGKKNTYFPPLEVLHHTQQITHKKPFSEISRSHFWGLLYYYRKHGGWFKV